MTVITHVKTTAPNMDTIVMISGLYSGFTVTGGYGTAKIGKKKNLSHNYKNIHKFLHKNLTYHALTPPLKRINTNPQSANLNLIR